MPTTFRRKVWVDASGRRDGKLGVVLLPDFLAFRTARPLMGDSFDWELEALTFATKILQNDCEIPTTFYTDCKNVVDLVTRGTKLNRKHSSQHRRQETIQTLQKFFHEESCWQLEWVCREQNRVADHVSKGTTTFIQRLKTRDRFQVYVLCIKEHKFYEYNECASTKQTTTTKVHWKKPRNLPPAKKIADANPETVARVQVWKTRKIDSTLFASRQPLYQIFTSA